mgnify:CR=1 FL=1
MLAVDFRDGFAGPHFRKPEPAPLGSEIPDFGYKCKWSCGGLLIRIRPDFFVHIGVIPKFIPSFCHILKSIENRALS